MSTFSGVNCLLNRGGHVVRSGQGVGKQIRRRPSDRELTPIIFPRTLRAMPDGTKLSEFAAWCAKHIAGDEKGEAQLFLDHLFRAFGHAGLKEAGATLEFRVAKATESRRGTAFADLVRNPVAFVKMKKRGADLQKHYRRVFDYWTRIMAGRS